MSGTVAYVPAIEIARRTGWTMQETQNWAQEHGARHPRFGWLIERGRAEQLIRERCA